MTKIKPGENITSGKFSIYGILPLHVAYKNCISNSSSLVKIAESSFQDTVTHSVAMLWSPQLIQLSRKTATVCKGVTTLTVDLSLGLLSTFL